MGSGYGRNSGRFGRWSGAVVMACLLLAQGLSGEARAASYRVEECAAVTSSYPWQDISTTGTTLSLADDGVSGNIALGFTFNFGGTNYTQLRIGANGWLFFGGTSTAYANTALPSAVDAAIMPYWDDLNPASTASRIRYQTLGTSPNRVFVVSFLSMPHYCGSGTGCTSNQTTGITETFQVQIHETTGEIVFSYNNMSTLGGGWTTGPVPSGGLPEPGATIGVEVSGTDYLQYSYNTNSIANGSTLLFSPYSATSQCGGTRFYMQNAVPDVTVATHRGAWDSTASVLQRKLSRTKAGAIASLGVAETSTTNNYDVLLLKLVSEPIATAQTISGKLYWVGGAQESNNAMNGHWHVHAYVTQGDTNNLRGTLYTDYTEPAGTNEWPTTAAGNGPITPLTLSSVAIQANDRIVIEAGYVARNTSNTSYTGSLWYGGTNATDLVPGGDETTYPGWWEFSQNLFPAAAINHIRLIHDGSAIACNPESVTVRACANSDCSSLYTGGVSGNLTAGSNSVAFAIANGASEVAVNIHLPTTTSGADPQTVRLGTSSLSVTPADASSPYCSNTTAGTYNNTTACDVSVAKAGLVVTVPTLAAGVASSAATIQAIRSSDSTTCIPLFASVTRTVALTETYANPASGTMDLIVNGSSLGSTTNFSLAFDAAGAAPLTSIQYDDAGSMTLNASYTGSTGNTPPDGGMVVTGSSTFVVKPYGFKLTGLTCDNADKTSTAGGHFCVAGGTFTGTVEAVRYDSSATNNLGAATPNFGHESTAQTVTFAPAALVNPTTAAGGTLSAFTSSATGTFSGTPNRATATMVWPNVGTITIAPSVGGNMSGTGYLGAGDLTSAGITDSAAYAGNAGRFYPHHFSLVGGSSVTGACGGTTGFTYMDQPSLGIAFTVEARNKANVKTSNYLYAATDGYVNVGTVSLVAENADAGTDLGGRVSGLGSPAWSGGAYAVSAAGATFSRGASPDGPYDSLVLGVKVTDVDAALSGTNMKATTTGDCTAVPDCDAVQVGSATKVRYGRLRMLNAYGSELLPLRVPIRAEYYQSGNWRLNTDDSTSCTSLAAGNVAIGNCQGNLVGQCSGAGGTPNAGTVTPTLTSASLASGQTTLVLTRPGCPAGTCPTGTLDLALNLGAAVTDTSCNPTHPGSTAGNLPWLRFAWCAGGGDPNARAKFGSSRAPYIYLRERY